MPILLRASRVSEGKAEIIVNVGQAVIGRLSSNNLVISGEDIEPIHAMIEYSEENNSYSIVDMASDSGVLLNGCKIEVIEKIKIGDLIEIGGVKISVLDADAILAQSNFVTKLPPPPKKEINKPEIAGHTNKINNENTKVNVNEKSKEEINRKTKLSFNTNRKTIRQLQDEEEQRETTNVKTAFIGGGLFQIGKEAPSGSVLEIVALWQQTIMDVQYFGGRSEAGEVKRLSEAHIGDEHVGHLIGVGPHSNVQNYKFASINSGKVSIYLNSEMQAKVRKGNKFEKIKGPTSLSLGTKDLAIVRHGPLDYILMNVSLPSIRFKKVEEFEGPAFLIFLFAFLFYVVLGGGIGLLQSKYIVKPSQEDEPWAQIIAAKQIAEKPTPTPPKPKVEIPKAKPAPVVPPPPKKDPPKPPPKVKVQPAPVPNKAAIPKFENKANDTAAGRKQPANKAPGNSGGQKAGGAGPASGQREGDKNKDLMGVEGGKKDEMGGINFDQLGAGMKTFDKEGIASISTGLKSSGGAPGGGSGSGKRGSHGFGGAGNGNSINVGGANDIAKGIGGGAGSDGMGGAGGAGGSAKSFGQKMSQAKVSVSEEDAVLGDGISRAEVLAVINSNLAQIRACYEKYLQGDRALGGRLLMKWTIGSDGRVSDASVGENQVGAQVGTCIKGKVLRWKFPSLKGGSNSANIVYPFNFSSMN